MAAHTARLPETRVRDYSFIKYQMMGHPYRSDISALLEPRARAVGYDPNLRSLPGSALRYAAHTWIGQLRQSKQSKRRVRRKSLLAPA
jgi:hypothetical protein